MGKKQKRTAYTIDTCAIYENDAFGFLVFLRCHPRAFANFQRALRRRGFKLSPTREAYYHPDHWRVRGPWSPQGVFMDAFTAKTSAARRWADTKE